MKALTLWQPWASLIAVGAKTIETRSWPTKHRGRIAIHAAQRSPEVMRLGPWFCTQRPAVEVGDGVLPAKWLLCDMDPDDLEPHALPLGAIVATADLVGCVPINPQVGHEHEVYDPPDDHVYTTVDGRALFRQRVIGDPSIPSNVMTIDLTSQLPLGDWSPGRWAWLLDDVQSTGGRCPVCWGDGVDPECVATVHGDLGVPAVQEVVTAARRQFGGPCPVCDGDGYCQPLPAKGKQGLWNWEVAT